MLSKIVGLFVEQYIGKECHGSNCDFTYEDEQMTRYHIMFIYPNNKKYILTLERESGECGSGYCCAQWINREIKEVDKFPPYNYIPKKTLYSNFNYTSTEECPEVYNSSVFSFDYDGDDSYYPWGSMKVDLNYFKELKRSPQNNKRPVWVVFGRSGLGKSFLFNSLNCGVTVFETDSHNYLPDYITDSVIIVGNKHHYMIDDVVSRIPENSMVVYVGFSDKPSNKNESHK